MASGRDEDGRVGGGGGGGGVGGEGVLASARRSRGAARLCGARARAGSDAGQRQPVMAHVIAHHNHKAASKGMPRATGASPRPRGQCNIQAVVDHGQTHIKRMIRASHVEYTAPLPRGRLLPPAQSPPAGLHGAALGPSAQSGASPRYVGDLCPRFDAVCGGLPRVVLRGLQSVVLESLLTFVKQHGSAFDALEAPLIEPKDARRLEN